MKGAPTSFSGGSALLVLNGIRRNIIFKTCV